MRTKRSIVLFLLSSALVLAASSTAMAQRWGRSAFPQSGACFFRDTNFRGEYFCVRSGDDVSRVPSEMNDEISSIRVFGRAEVTVFKDVRFAGRGETFRSDIPNLKGEGWNDAISSLRVQNEPRFGGDRRGDRRDDDRRDGGFGGGGGMRREDADAIVRRAYEDVLHREPDQDGFRQYRSRIIDDGWTEAQVRDSLRKSPEYRELASMTPAKAEQIVRAAYLSVLRREPDAGARGYVERVLRDRWSQADVERELRKSDEYRNRR